MSIKELIPWKREAQRGLSPMMDFERTFDRFAESLWSPFASKWLDFPAATRAMAIEPGLTGPDLQVKETDKAYEVSMKLPGIEKKNVKVDVRGDRLTIQAEQKEEKRSKSGYSSTHQSFFRSFTLPDGVNGKEAKADFKDGELRIELPKSEPAHRVEVR